MSILPDVDFSQLLKDVLKETKVSMRDLADMMVVSEVTLRRMKLGHSSLKGKNSLIAIAVIGEVKSGKPGLTVKNIERGMMTILTGGDVVVPFAVYGIIKALAAIKDKHGLNITTIF